MTTRPSVAAIPGAKAVRDLLENQLGRDVEVSPCSPLVPGVKEPGSVAVFVDKGVRTHAVVSFDLRLSAYAGAAIGLIPKGAAEACIAARSLTPIVRDNLSEVFATFSALLQKSSSVQMYAMYEPGELPPADISAQSRAIGRRLDLTVKVHGYGFGRLAIVVC